jgi:hypothetical protein
MKKEDLIKKIAELQIHYKAENAWENTQYKPYTIQLVELSKVLEILKAIETNGKKVSQYNKDSTLIKTYNSIVDASKATGANISGISKCCRNQQLTAGGYIWKYFEKNVRLF